ncbi:hypothetical protein N9H93_00125 [Rhizobiaceae bacterium]|nr:hypothetical protein [Rhizobiaceae bacterium]
MKSLTATLTTLGIVALAASGCTRTTNDVPGGSTTQITTPASAGGTSGTFEPGEIAAERAS